MSRLLLFGGMLHGKGQILNFLEKWNNSFECCTQIIYIFIFKSGTPSWLLFYFSVYFYSNCSGSLKIEWEMGISKVIV